MIHSELLRNLTISLATREEVPVWDSLMRESHYLGLSTLPGESLRYIARSGSELLALIETWESELAEAPVEGPKKKKAKAKAVSDLVLAKNPGNAFPVYQLIKKSDGFSREELLRAIELLRRTDSQLKSSALDARLLLEQLIWHSSPTGIDHHRRALYRPRSGQRTTRQRPALGASPTAGDDCHVNAPDAPGGRVVRPHLGDQPGAGCA